MNDKIKAYYFYLPCYLPEDDLEHQLVNGNSIHKSFANMADTYDKCAKLCRRMAGLAIEMPELDVDISEHGILIAGPEERLDVLVQEHVLSFYVDDNVRDDILPFYHGGIDSFEV